MKLNLKDGDIVYITNGYKAEHFLYEVIKNETRIKCIRTFKGNENMIGDEFPILDFWELVRVNFHNHPQTDIFK